jgi:predicted transposase YdaD
MTHVTQKNTRISSFLNEKKVDPKDICTQRKRTRKRNKPLQTMMKTPSHNSRLAPALTILRFGAENLKQREIICNFGVIIFRKEASRSQAAKRWKQFARPIGTQAKREVQNLKKGLKLFF